MSQDAAQGVGYSALDSQNRGPALDMDRIVGQEMDRLLSARSPLVYRFDGLPNVGEDDDMDQGTFDGPSQGAFNTQSQGGFNGQDQRAFNGQSQGATQEMD
jgi:hypothetical protein